MRIRSAFILAILLTAVQGQLLVCKAADLTIMAEDAADPFSRADGTGYANDIVRASFAASGIAVKFDVVPYARCKRDLLAGRTPACFSMSWLEEFKPAVVFSDQPIFHVYADVFLSDHMTRKITKTEDLTRGDTLGIVNDYEYPKTIRDLRSLGVTVQPAPNETSLLHMLTLGRLDAAVIMTNDLDSRVHNIRETGAAKKIRFGFRSGTLDSYIGFSRQNPKGEWARQEYDEGFRRIQRSGAAKQIEDRWKKALSQ